MKSKTLNFVKIRGQIIAPMDDETAQYLEKKADGICFEVREVGIIRSPHFHRKFMASLRTAWENLPELNDYPDFEPFRKAVLILAGYFDVIILPTPAGPVQYKQARSMAYGEIEEKEFRELYEKCKNVLAKYFGITEEYYD